MFLNVPVVCGHNLQPHISQTHPVAPNPSDLLDLRGGWCGWEVGANSGGSPLLFKFINLDLSVYHFIITFSFIVVDVLIGNSYQPDNTLPVARECLQCDFDTRAIWSGIQGRAAASRVDHFLLQTPAGCVFSHSSTLGRTPYEFTLQ